MPSDLPFNLRSLRLSARRLIGRGWLAFFGWSAEAVPFPPKAVVIAAPHTSNWDFPFSLAVAYVLDLEVSWLGKHTLLKPPYGWFFRALGVIPVDRRDRNNLVASVAEVLNAADKLLLVVPPEGTRSRTARWKTGFYYIALRSGVPIVLGYLDYEKKRGGLGQVIYPTGDIEADMAKIKSFYASIKGKHPDRMSEITLGATPKESPAGAPAPAV